MIFRALSVALTLTVVAAAPSVARAASACADAPNMLIVLDRSSSMLYSSGVAGQNRWQAAKAALQTAVAAHSDGIDFGLLPFPGPTNECHPGQLTVPLGDLETADDVATALATPPPEGGAWTPMSQSLDEAAAVDALRDENRKSYVLLITDGWQWCYPYDDATRFDPVDSVRALAQAGIETFVVGFGGSVDVLTLNRASVEGGHAIAGCDPAGWSIDSPDKCYYQAHLPGDLDGALEQIAREITEEVCDNLDNDCDDRVDEDVTRACQTACGEGVEVCTDGEWGECDADIPADAEICDGDDNDCDGEIDEGCECQAGDPPQLCGEDEGECSQGVQYCINGQWGRCDGAIGPHDEQCDGDDDDCDGVTDNGCDCVDGDEQSCGTDEGLCQAGRQTCTNGRWSECDGTGPVQEVCDLADNDCNGLVDDGDICPEGLCIDGQCRAFDRVDPNDHPGDEGSDGQTDAGGDPGDDVYGGDPAAGCECAVASGPSNPAASLLGLLLALGAVALRRRR